MDSFSDAIIGSFVSPVIMEMSGAQSATFRYAMGDTVIVAGIVGIKQDETHVYRVDERGGKHKVRTCTLVIANDPDGPYKGVGEPQLGGTFTEVVDGEDGRTWAVEPNDGGGMQAITGTHIRIALREVAAVGKSYPNREVTA